jgi:serine/threonine-protein kinase
VPGGLHPEGATTLVMVDRTGSARELPVEPRPYLGPRLSPDGNRVALFTQDAIWIYDIKRGMTALFERTERPSRPIWTRDGKQITYVATGGLFSKSADGSGSARQLSTVSDYPESWSANGELAITRIVSSTDWKISVLSAGDQKRMPQPFAADSPSQKQGYPDFSPDGRWLAYMSSETGRDEVYVRPYPGPGQVSKVSINGGAQPVWSHTSGELFFTVADRAPSTDFYTVMVVTVTTTPTFKAGIPRALPAQVRLTMPMRGYDVSADGQRFFTLRETKATLLPPPSQMIVVLNWVEELKRRVPAQAK